MVLTQSKWKQQGTERQSLSYLEKLKKKNHVSKMNIKKSKPLPFENNMKFKEKNDKKVITIREDKNSVENDSPKILCEKDKQIADLIKKQEEILNEHKNKPFWFGGIIEKDISLEDKLNNIEECEKAIERQFSIYINQKYNPSIELSIQNENITAKGNIWGKSKKIEKRQEKERKDLLRKYKQASNRLIK